jgi:MerR family gold-responsive transcriptional activator of gol and ges genes
MLIREAAQSAGVTPQTLRYYEQRGLVRPTGRRASGYREYTGEQVRVVRFIKRAQDLGFSLDDIAALLKLRAARGTRPSVRKVAEHHLGDLDARIADLTRMRKAVAALVQACHAGTDVHCPILEALDPEGADRRDPR